MQYIENELLRCKTALQKADGERYSFLYAIQQALEWSLDPIGFASPVDTVLNGKIGTMDIQEDLEDCSVVHRQPLSSDICCHSG
jgi:hypothetical protein